LVPEASNPARGFGWAISPANNQGLPAYSPTQSDLNLLARNRLGASPRPQFKIVVSKDPDDETVSFVSLLNKTFAIEMELCTPPIVFLKDRGQD
jgi:hypothetical protein